MTPTPIRTFRANLRAYLTRVAAGESLSVTYRGRVVAEVHPVGVLKGYQRDEDVEAGLRNLGIDPACGGCMAVFYTGTGATHTCGAGNELTVEVSND